MADLKDLRVKVQTMTRSEYMQAKHIPNALPSPLIQSESVSSVSSIKQKPGNSRLQSKIFETEEEVVLTNKPESRKETVVSQSITPKQSQPKQSSFEPEYFSSINNDRGQPQPRTKVLREEPVRRAGFPEDDPHENCKRQINTLENQNQILQRRLDECMQHRSFCEERLRQLEAEKNNIEQLYRKLLMQPEQTDKSKELERTNTALRQERDQMRGEADAAKYQAAQLGAENQALSRMKRLFEEQIERLANERQQSLEDAFRIRLKEVEDENQRLRSHIVGLNALLEEKNKEIESLNLQLLNIEVNLNTVNEGKMKYLVNVVLLAAEVERLHHIIQDMKAGLQLFREENETKIASLSSEVSRLQHQLDLATSNSSPEQSFEKDVKIVLMAAEIDRLRDDLLELNGELSVLRGIKDERSKDLRRSMEFEKERESADHDRVVFKDRIVTLESEVNRLQLEGAKYQKDYNDLELKYLALEKSYKAVIEALKAMRNSQSGILSDSQMIAEAWNEEKSTLAAKVAELRFKNMKMEEMSILYMVEIERLHHQIEQLIKMQAQ